MAAGEIAAGSGGILDGSRRFEVASAPNIEEHGFDESSYSCRRLMVPV